MGVWVCICMRVCCDESVYVHWCMVYVYSCTNTRKTEELSMYKVRTSSGFINTGLVQMMSASK